MKELTVEEALNNIAIALDAYVGKKSEHILLEQSFNLVKSKVLPVVEVIEDKK